MEKTQHQLPMINPYYRDSFYVRPCYRTLYPKILEIADTDVIGFCVTVTGTPGIGKSLFYNYVLTMLRKQRPDTTIVTASFNQTQDLEDCYVFVPNCKPRQLSSDEFYKIDQIHPKSLHLYDGAPKTARSVRKMMVFTGPNPAWMKYLTKVPGAKKFFMDGWTYKELLEANRRLNLGIAEQDIYERYMLFGGVARYCLGDLDVLAQGKAALTKAVGYITTLSDVRDCLNDKKDANAVVHRLFHYLPNLDNRAEPKLVFGSKRIADLVNERLSVSLQMMIVVTLNNI